MKNATCEHKDGYQFRDYNQAKNEDICEFKIS